MTDLEWIRFYIRLNNLTMDEVSAALKAAVVIKQEEALSLRKQDKDEREQGLLEASGLRQF